MKSILTLSMTLGFLLITSISKAAPRVFVSRSKEQAHLYSENNHWQIKLTRVGNDGWTELVEQRIFKTEKQAESYLNIKNYLVEVKDPHRFDSDKELKGTSADVLWTVKNDWSWDWEIKYAAWIQNEVDIDFFQKYKIKTDCADVMYSLRWIFARKNFLPAANRISDSKWFTHRSMRDEWKNLPTSVDWSKDKRFLAALNYLTDLAYTHTLYRDSYPIEINAEALLPGAVNLQIHGNSGHTMVLFKQFPATSGVRVYVFASTTPRAVRILSDHRIYTSEFVENENALLRMRWPLFSGDKVSLVAGEKMPYFSKKQFSLGMIDVNRILNPNPNWQLEYDDSIKSMLTLLEQRKKVVQDGYDICFPNKCPIDSPNYDNWGTPSRDERLRKAIGYFNEEISRFYSEFATRSKTEKIFELNGQQYTLSQLLFASNYALFSSDPNSSLERRWMLGPDNFLIGSVEAIQDALVKRRTKLQQIKLVCANNACIAGSENDKKLNTSLENFAVERYLDITKKMIIEFPDYKDALTGIFTKSFHDGVLKKNYSAWLETVARASNSPRSESDFLEGQFDRKFDRYDSPKDFNVQESNGAVVKLISEQSGTELLYKLLPNSFERISFQNVDEKIIYIDLRKNITATCYLDKCILFEITSGLKKYEIPTEILLETKILDYRSGKLIVAEPKKQEYRKYFSKLKVFDLQNQETIIEEKELRIMTAQLSVDGNYLSYSALSPESNVDSYDFIYYVSDLKQSPAKANLSQNKIEFGSMKQIKVNGHKIFYQSGLGFKIYNFDTDQLLQANGFLSSYDNNKIIINGSPDCVCNFKEVSFDEKSFQLIYKDLGDFSNLRIENLRRFKDMYILYAATGSDFLVIKGDENGFSIKHITTSKYKVMEFADTDLYASREGNVLKSQFYSKQMQAVAAVSELPYDFIPNTKNKNSYYFQYNDIQYEDGPYMTNDVNRPIGSTNYRIEPGGFLVFKGKEIFISKE